MCRWAFRCILNGRVHSGDGIAMKMNKKYQLASALLFVALTILGPRAVMGQTYATREARETTERMIAAHGGMNPWEEAPSFSFSIAMYLPQLPIIDGRKYGNNWRHYSVAVEPKTSQGFVFLPDDGADEPIIGYDGTDIWYQSYGFDIPNFNDGPAGLLYFHYSMLNLPWLTQTSNARLRQRDNTESLGYYEDLVVLDLTFGEEGGGRYELFVDPETDLLRGIGQTAAMPDLPGAVFPSPPDSTLRGSIYRLIDEYTEVDGLIIPSNYTSIRMTEDGNSVMGSHIVYDASFSRPFEQGSEERPAGSSLFYTRPR